MRPFLIDALALVTLLGGPPAGAKDALPTDAIALSPVVRENIPAGADNAALVKLAEEIITAWRDKPLRVDAYQPGPLRALLGATLSLELAHQRGEKSVAGALAEAYALLDGMATTLWLAVALDDLGDPVHGRLPPSELDVAKAYVASLKALPEHCAARIAVVTDGDAVSVRGLRARAGFHQRRYEHAAATAWGARLATASDEPTDALNAAGYAAVSLSESKARQLLSPIVTKHPDLRWRAGRYLDTRARVESVKAAATAVQASDTPATTLALIDATTALHRPGARIAYAAIRDAEARYPDNADIRLRRVGWLIAVNALQPAVSVITTADAQGLAFRDQRSVSMALVARMLTLTSVVMGSQFDKVRELAEHARSLLDRLDGKAGGDRFAVEMAAAYLDAIGTLAGDGEFAKAVQEAMGAGGVDDAMRKDLAERVGRILRPIERKYADRLELWKLLLLRDVLLDEAAAHAALPAFLARMDKAVRKADRNAADMFAALALTTSGRRPGERARLEQALDRVLAVHKRLEQHRERLLKDGKLKLAVDPPEGAVPTGDVYSFIGALRNMLRLEMSGDSLLAWDKTTVQLMRRGARRLQELDAHWTSGHAQVMSHRCWVQVIGQDFAQAGQCLQDLNAAHPDDPGARGLYAAALAGSGRESDAAILFGQQVQRSDIAAGFRYDAHKWLAQMKLGAGDMAAARKHVTEAIALRPKVQSLGAALDYKYVPMDGSFNVGVGIDRDGVLVNQVLVSAHMWSLLPAPVDDAKLDAFLR